MKRVAVFCGSSPGARPGYAAALRELGETLVRRNLGLVFGGGGVGLMGVVADAVLDAGGEVVGVLPQALGIKEIAHSRVEDIRLVSSMHERKALMADLSDAFIAAPGGFGTLEEIFEALTWSQLGFQDKPCGVLEVDGFFAPLLAFLDSTVAERFVREKHRALLCVSEDPSDLLDQLERKRAEGVEPVEKWIDRDPS